MDKLAPLGPVYQAGTLSGNPVAMQAGFATLKILQKNGFYQNLQKKADRMVNPIREALENKNGCIQSCGSMFNIFFGLKKVSSKEDLKSLDEKLFVEFFRHLFERGVYISPSSHEAWFLSDAHLDQDIDYAVECILDFLKKI